MPPGFWPARRSPQRRSSTKSTGRSGWSAQTAHARTPSPTLAAYPRTPMHPNRDKRNSSTASDQGPLTSVRTELLPSLPPNRTPGRGDRDVNMPSGLPLHRAAIRRAETTRAGMSSREAVPATAVAPRSRRPHQPGNRLDNNEVAAGRFRYYQRNYLPRRRRSNPAKSRAMRNAVDPAKVPPPGTIRHCWLATLT